MRNTLWALARNVVGAQMENKVKEQTSLHARLRWIVPLLLGFITVVICGIVYRAAHRPIPANIIEEAQALSVDPAQLDDVEQLDSKLFNKQQLTTEEWNRYQNYAMGSNLVFKRKLARHLCAARGSRYEQSARSLVWKLIRDEDSETRANALISLRIFQDPSWREVARQFLTDPAALPRKMGATMLEQDNKK